MRSSSVGLGSPAVALALLLTVLAGSACGGDRPSGASESPEGSGATDLPLEPRILVSHRGASAYAPEHTLAAYRLAIEQGADFIEPDLQITRDSVLIALHDETLERTTNVADVFPDRFRDEPAPPGRGGAAEGDSVRRWYAVDFTLEEVRSLDAGSWFGADFAGARVPTLAEVIELAVESGVGIFPETKAPDVYGSLGFDMEGMLLEALAEYGLHVPDGVPGTPVVIQSFSAESMRILRLERGTPLNLTFLVGRSGGDRWLTPDGLAEVTEFADGIGPTKSLILDDPTVVERAHAQGLTVIPWTFSSDRPGGFADGTQEMAHYLYDIGVDGLFTDNPDHFPEAPIAGGS